MILAVSDTAFWTAAIGICVAAGLVAIALIVSTFALRGERTRANAALQVARDSLALEHARRAEELDDRRRRQAAQVWLSLTSQDDSGSPWPGWQRHGFRVAIHNDSSQPVYDAWVFGHQDDTATDSARSGWYPIGVIAPGLLDGVSGSFFYQATGVHRDTVVGVEFTDENGQRWRRNNTGKLVGIEPLSLDDRQKRLEPFGPP